MQVATATREVIVAGGSFNTPQLLMLSGIGPADELRAHGIDVRVDLPGVGANLQDRYEVTVVTRMTHPFDLVTGGAFHPPRPDDKPDPYLAAWRRGKGAYTTNGGLLAVVAASRPELEVPDLFLFALPAQFRGYYPGYAEDLELQPDRLTWAILKAHTENRAGTVRLRSADPSDAPDIRFRYFEEGSDADGRDLDAVVAGIGIARGLTRRLSRDGDVELLPGAGGRHRGRRPGLRACERLGPPRLRHLRDRAGRRPRRGARQPLPGARRAGSAGRRRIGVSPHPRLLHRLGRLHGEREGRGRHPRRRRTPRLCLAETGRHRPRRPTLRLAMYHLEQTSMPRTEEQPS